MSTMNSRQLERAIMRAASSWFVRIIMLLAVLASTFGASLQSAAAAPANTPPPPPMEAGETVVATGESNHIRIAIPAASSGPSVQSAAEGFEVWLRFDLLSSKRAFASLMTSGNNPAFKADAHLWSGTGDDINPAPTTILTNTVETLIKDPNEPKGRNFLSNMVDGTTAHLRVDSDIFPGGFIQYDNIWQGATAPQWVQYKPIRASSGEYAGLECSDERWWHKDIQIQTTAVDADGNVLAVYDPYLDTSGARDGHTPAIARPQTGDPAKPFWYQTISGDKGLATVRHEDKYGPLYNKCQPSTPHSQPKTVTLVGQCASQAQPNVAIFSGEVRDQNDALMAGIAVTLTGVLNNPVISTNAQGAFAFTYEQASSHMGDTVIATAGSARSAGVEINLAMFAACKPNVKLQPKTVTLVGQCASQAQPNVAIFSGEVRDQNDALMAGIAVTLTGVLNNPVISTNAQGAFAFTYEQASSHMGDTVIATAGSARSAGVEINQALFAACKGGSNPERSAEGALACSVNNNNVAIGVVSQNTPPAFDKALPVMVTTPKGKVAATLQFTGRVGNAANWLGTIKYAGAGEYNFAGQIGITPITSQPRALTCGGNSHHDLDFRAFDKVDCFAIPQRDNKFEYVRIRNFVMTTGEAPGENFDVQYAEFSQYGDSGWQNAGATREVGIEAGAIPLPQVTWINWHMINRGDINYGRTHVFHDQLPGIEKLTVEYLSAHHWALQNPERPGRWIWADGPKDNYWPEYLWSFNSMVSRCTAQTTTTTVETPKPVLCLSASGELDKANMTFAFIGDGQGASKWRLIQTDEFGHISQILTYGDGNKAIGGPIAGAYGTPYVVQFTNDNGDNWVGGTQCTFMFTKPTAKGDRVDPYAGQAPIGSYRQDIGGSIQQIDVFAPLYIDGQLQLPDHGGVWMASISTLLVHFDQGNKVHFTPAANVNAVLALNGEAERHFTLGDEGTQSWKEGLHSAEAGRIKVTTCQWEKGKGFTGNFHTYGAQLPF